MASRKDQLWSYQFMLQRVMSALVYRKTDAEKSPFKAAGAAVFAGIMIAVLALGATLAIAFFRSTFANNVDWTTGEVVVLEKETGTPYVVFPTDAQLEASPESSNISKADQRLYPVTNFASAALLAGTTETYEVNQGSLTGEEAEDGVGDVPQMGMPIGTEGLPPSLPDPEELLDGRWAVCTDPTAEADSEVPESVLYVGTQPDSSAELGSGEVLIFEDDGDVYLAGDSGYKHKITEPEATLSALTLQQQSRVPVAPAFAVALPEGAELQTPDISGAGETSSVEGAQVGEIYSSSGGDRTEYYVALSNGAAPVTEVQADLIMDEHGQSEPEQNNAVVQAAGPDSDHYHDFIPDPDDQTAERAMPAQITDVPDGWGDGVACAGFAGNDGTATVAVDVDVRSQGVSTQGVSESGSVYADRIVVPPGRGMLVGSGEAGDGAVSLITSTGQLYPIAEPTNNEADHQQIVAPVPARTALGFDEASPVAMPGHLMALLPVGPTMDPYAAMENAQVNIA